MSDTQPKLEVNVGGAWYPLVMFNTFGPVEQCFYKAPGGGIQSTWRFTDIDKPFPTRPAPVVDAEGHTVTPHEPVAGVTLWNDSGQDDLPDVCVDGIRAGYLSPVDGPVENENGRACYTVKNTKPFKTPLEVIRAFRDRIRAERRAAAVPAPSQFTAAERAEIAAIARAAVE